MRLIYKFYIEHTEGLDRLMRVSNNLYNQALYEVRQKLIVEGTWLCYEDLNKIMRTKKNLEGECNYRLLKTQCAQQILLVIHRTMKSYFRCIKDWKENPDKYTARPRLPKYRPRGGMFNVFYTNQCCQIRDGYIRLSKDLSIHVPQWDKYRDRIQSFNQVRIVPNRVNVAVEIIYEVPDAESKARNGNYASIDLGLKNLVTMIMSDGSCEIWSGDYLKAYNQGFNKRLARLQSIKDKQGIKGVTKMILRMYDNRDKYIEDSFHQITRQIVNRLVEKEIGTLVIGYNAGWKQNADMGKVNNQKFVQMPFARLLSYLKYKCEKEGIEVIIHEESYTSICDALALETIEKHESYLGKRAKRGLFESSVGLVINADQNGALNILRKVVCESEFIRIVDRGHISLCPVRHRTPFRQHMGRI